NPTTTGNPTGTSTPTQTSNPTSTKKAGAGESCQTSDDCDQTFKQYTCVQMSEGNPSICLQECSENIDCPGLDNHCCGLSNVLKNVCVPSNFDNGNCMAD